jgi:ribosomal protein S18 acetylase RimI-like enzyme
VPVDASPRATVREMSVSDLRSVALLHQAIFPGQLLTMLGTRLLVRFYYEFATGEESLALVAVADGVPVGFVAATRDKAALFRRFYRTSLLSLALTASMRPRIWSMLWRGSAARRTQLRYVLRSLFGRAHTPSPSRLAADDVTVDIPTRLMSIGVASAWRGTGLAEKLVNVLCERLRDNGVDVVGLSVRQENARAIRYYDRTGWIVHKRTDSGVYYYRGTRDSSLTSCEGDASREPLPADNHGSRRDA